MSRLNPFAFAIALALTLAPAIASADPPPNGAPPGYTPAPIASPQGGPQVAPQYAPQYAMPYPYYPYYPPPYAPMAYPPPSLPKPKPVRREVPYLGGPVPEGAVVETQRSGLFMAGTATLLGLWGVSAIYASFACPPGAAADQCHSNTSYLFIPVVGPFMTAADSNSTFGGRNLSIFDGVVQSLSLVAVIGGLTQSRDVLVFHDKGTARRALRHEARWSISPSAVGALAGASLTLKGF